MELSPELPPEPPESPPEPPPKPPPKPPRGPLGPPGRAAGGAGARRALGARDFAVGALTAPTMGTEVTEKNMWVLNVAKVVHEARRLGGVGGRKGVVRCSEGVWPSRRRGLGKARECATPRVAGRDRQIRYFSPHLIRGKMRTVGEGLLFYITFHS